MKYTEYYAFYKQVNCYKNANYNCILSYTFKHTNNVYDTVFYVLCFIFNGIKEKVLMKSSYTCLLIFYFSYYIKCDSLKSWSYVLDIINNLLSDKLHRWDIGDFRNY